MSFILHEAYHYFRIHSSFLQFGSSWRQDAAEMKIAPSASIKESPILEYALILLTYRQEIHVWIPAWKLLNSDRTIIEAKFQLEKTTVIYQTVIKRQADLTYGENYFQQGLFQVDNI